MAIIPTADNFKVLPQGVDTRFSTGIRPVDVTGNAKQVARGLGIWAQNREDTLVGQAVNDYMNYCAENQQKYRNLSNDAALRDEDGNDVLQGMNRDRMDVRARLTRGFGARAMDSFNRHVAGAERNWTASTTAHRYDQERSADKMRMEVATDNYWKQSVDALERGDDEAFKQSLSDAAAANRFFQLKYGGFSDPKMVDALVGYGMATHLISAASVLKESDPQKAQAVLEQYAQMIPAQQYAAVRREVVAAKELAAGAAAFQEIMKTGSIEVGGTGIGTQAWGQAFQNAVKTDKRPYSQGINRSDCSSFVGEVVGGMNLPKDVKKLFVGTSDSIIQNLGRKYGYGVQGGKLPANIGAGVVISLDTGETRTGFDKNHWNGIDHIAVTVQGNDGKIYVAEKTRSGAKMTEYNRWKNFGTYKRAKVWTVDVSPAVGQSSVQAGGKRMAVNFADMNMSRGQMMEIIRKSFPGRSDNFYRGAMELAGYQAEANQERKHQRDEQIANQLSQQHLAIEQANFKMAQDEHKMRMWAMKNGEAFNQLSPAQQVEFNTTQGKQGEENWFYTGWKLGDPAEMRNISLADVASLTAGDAALQKVMTNTWYRYNNPKKYKPGIGSLALQDVASTYRWLGIDPNNMSNEDKTRLGRVYHFAFANIGKKKNGKPVYASMADALHDGAKNEYNFLSFMPN